MLSAPWATARAVARLDKLARWTFPLLEDGGTLVALKGSRAQEELSEDEPTLRQAGHGQRRGRARTARACSRCRPSPSRRWSARRRPARSGALGPRAVAGPPARRRPS